MACPACAGHIHQFIGQNRVTPRSWFAGLGFGLAAAVGGAIVWALVTKWSQSEWGLLAVLIAIGVSKAVIYGAGDKRGRPIQILTIGLSIVGIFIGKGLIAAWIFWPQIIEGHPEANTTMARLLTFVMAPVVLFHLFDLLWYGIAIWEGWRLARIPKLAITGPFVDSPDEPPLEFDVPRPVDPGRRP